MTTAQRTITLGGRTITRIGLGTNRLEEDDESRAVVRAAIERGYGLIDTADIYTGGASETVIGSVLAERPAEIMVATKGAMIRGSSGTRTDGTPAYLASAIDASLRRLKLDAIDLYYLHRPSDETPIEESVGALRDAQTAGKIKLIGLSNVTVAQIERARNIAEIVAIQNHFSLLQRGADDVIDYATANGIAFVPFFPIDRGQFGDADAVLGRIAKRYGATSVQIALRWLLDRSPVMLPIPGTRSVSHLDANFAALDLTLSPDERAELSALGN